MYFQPAPFAVSWTLYGLVTSNLGKQDNLLQLNNGQNLTVSEFLYNNFHYQHDMIGYIVLILAAFIMAFWTAGWAAFRYLNFNVRPCLLALGVVFAVVAGHHTDVTRAAAGSQLPLPRHFHVCRGAEHVPRRSTSSVEVPGTWSASLRLYFNARQLMVRAWAYTNLDGRCLNIARTLELIWNLVAFLFPGIIAGLVVAHTYLLWWVLQVKK